MDLIIKNLEKLQDYHTKEGKHPIERLVLDFDKLSEMEGFTKIFEKSCEKYAKVGESYLVPIEDIQKEIESNWKPAEPTLKEVTERMQSEFDATGIDTKIFMNERVIKR